MTAATAPPEGSPLAVAPRLTRFSAVSRVVHWSTTIVLFVLMATAAVLYLPQVATLVGRRQTMKTIHVWSGLLLPVPVLVGLLAGRRLPTLRSDLGRLGRWDRADSRWLRSFGRDPSVPPAKFNAGQKLFAGFMAGALISMLLTGLIMRWFSPFPLEWRTGATFVHDWLGIALTVAAAGHLTKALSEPSALRSMVVGWVPAEWARRHRPRWYTELTGKAPAEAPPAARPRPVRRRLVLALAAGLVAVAAAGGVLAANRSGDRDTSPGGVAVAWEEAVDRSDLAGLYELAGSQYRKEMAPDEFTAEMAATLLDLGVVDVKGNVVEVSVAKVREKGADATVTLNLVFADGLEVPQEILLRREDDRWGVIDYDPIGQGELIRACVESRTNSSCMGQFPAN